MLQYEIDHRLYMLSMEGRSCVLQVFIKGAKRIFEVAYHFDHDKTLSIQHPPLNLLALAAVTYKGTAYKRIVDASPEIAYVALKQHFEKLTRHQAKG